MRAKAAKLPPWWRVLLAFAAAPAVAALAFSCVEPLYAGLPSLAQRIRYTFPLVAVFGGYAPTLVLGVPLYLLLRPRVRATYLDCAAAGAAVAALPWLVGALFPAPGDASIDGHATDVGGHVTWYGVWYGVRVAAEAGVFGAIGGLVFRLVAGAGRRGGAIRSARET